MANDLAAAITRLADILEKMYPLMQQQIEATKESKGSEEGEDRAKAAGKDVVSAGGASMLGSGQAAVSSIASTLKQTYIPTFSQIEGSREMVQGIKAPVQRAYSEIEAFSQKGIMLQESEMEKIAQATASQQAAAQANMAMLRPMVGEGIKGNISAQLGEMYTNWENDVANKGIFSATGSRVSDAASYAVDTWKKGAQAIFGVDVFGR